MSAALPPIPPKRYFTIGEVSELCAVKPYVLRYWEQEFSQLRPMKRRGNRRYYQHHEVLLVRRIRDLLYEQRFTISGARDRLAEGGGVSASGFDAGPASESGLDPMGLLDPSDPQDFMDEPDAQHGGLPQQAGASEGAGLQQALGLADLRRELLAIRRLLSD